MSSFLCLHGCLGACGSLQPPGSPHCQQGGTGLLCILNDFNRVLSFKFCNLLKFAKVFCFIFNQLTNAVGLSVPEM